MNFYIVGHVVNDRAKTDALIAKLNQLNAKRIMPSLWILQASGTIRDLEIELRNVIDLDDNIFIASITPDCKYENLLITNAELLAFLL
jgi:hypothetical protein